MVTSPGVIIGIGLLLPVLIVLAVLGYGITLFNALVRARTLVEEGWSGIEVQLQRRADLVPRLVDVVRAHAAHERGVFEEVAARRSAAAGAADRGARVTAERALRESIGHLVAVAEAYPDITADQAFVGLMRSLSEVEETLQDARRYYNATVRDLNQRVETVPSALVARAFAFRPASYFDAAEDADRAPAIDLARPPAPAA